MPLPTLDEAVEIIKAHEPHFTVYPGSHEVRTVDNPHQGWVAGASIWEHHPDKMIHHPIWGQNTALRFATKDEADQHAVLLAAQWLENNA